METRRRLFTILDLSVPLLSLLIGYLFDRIDYSVRTNFAETFQRFPMLLSLATLPILTAAIALILVWYLFRKTQATRRAAAAYIVFGSIGVLLFASVFIQIPVLNSAIFKPIRLSLGRFGFGSIYWISSFLLVTGIAGVVMQREG